MDLLEVRIFESYHKVHVDASFPADTMEKERGRNSAVLETGISGIKEE